MAARFAVVGTLLLFSCFNAAATSGSASTCLQDAFDPLLAVEDGHGSLGNNGAGVELLQKTATEHTEKKFTAEKANATKAGEQAALTQEAALMQQILGKQLHEQIQAELTMDGTVMKDKLVLAILELLAITSICGVDRCFMGQACLGVIKGVTVGGLGIWATIDWFVVMINCLGSWEGISSFGFHAQFYANTVQPAYWVALIGMTIYLVNMCCCGGYYTKKQGAEPEETSVSKDAEANPAGKPAEATAK